MRKQERVKAILAALDAKYPYEDKCYLNYSTPYELLFATMLSAQCTDDRVNMVTADLFVQFATLESFATAGRAEMEQAIKSTGFFRTKAKNIIATAQALLTDHGGEVPSGIESLTALPGVGRKTANVVRCHIFALPSVVVDTHVKRISGRLGLTKNTDPVKIEHDLMNALPKSHWIRYNHQIIAFGREICKAPRAKCAECFMPHLCPAAPPI